MAQTTNANGRTKFKVLYDKGAVSVYPQLPYLPKRPQQHSFAVSTWTKSWQDLPWASKYVRRCSGYHLEWWSRSEFKNCIMTESDFVSFSLLWQKVGVEILFNLSQIRCEKPCGWKIKVLTRTKVFSKGRDCVIAKSPFSIYKLAKTLMEATVLDIDQKMTHSYNRGYPLVGTISQKLMPWKFTKTMLCAGST